MYKCGNKFRTEVELREHVLAKHPKQEYTCLQCDKKFKTEVDLKEHVLAIHPNPGFACLQCDNNFKSGVELRGHVLAIHPKQEYACLHCDNKFKIEVDLREHILEIHPKQEYACLQCDNKFKNEVDLRKHVKAIHPKQNRYCDECDLVFKDISMTDFLKSLDGHKRNVCPYPKERRRDLDNTKSVCLKCGFKSNSSMELKKHLRDVHSENLEDLSPVQKKIKFCDEIDEIMPDEVAENIIVDNILSNIEQLNIDDNMEIDEVQQRSVQMDKKVLEKRKRDEKEEKEYEEKKRQKEEKMKAENIKDTKLKEEKNKQEKKRQKENMKAQEISETQEREAQSKLGKNRNEADEKKASREKMNLKIPKGVKEIDHKYHHLVGHFKVKYPSKSDGVCQNTSKAAILYSDPRKGTEVAYQENKYLVAHFDHFEQSYKWPHTIKIGGGKTKKFHKPEEFKSFLEAHPEACYMWGDHQQLQITSNRYQVPVNVLTIDSVGNGTVLREPFTPNPALKEFAVVPEGAKVKEVWLLYTNGNHYDALIEEDDSLLTLGTIEDIEKAEMKAAERIVTENEEESANERTVNDVAMKVVPRDVENKMESNKGPALENKDETIKKLKKELKTIQVEKQVLEVLYRGSEEVVKKLEEEKDRLLIEVKDMKEYAETGEEVHEPKEIKQVCKFKWKGGNMEGMAGVCTICDFKANNLSSMTNHMAWKHRNVKQVEQQVVRPKQKVNYLVKCTVYNCVQAFKSNEDMNKHMKSEHMKQYNCDKCDFQATNILILNKHINLKHRGEFEENLKVFKCEVCEKQFSDYWNMMNHIKERHEITELCRHYKKGRCKFSDEVCWLVHEKKKEISNKRNETTEEFKCYVCEQIFRTKNGMMRHRKQFHPVGLKICKDDEETTCEFGPKRCWYIHVNDVEQDFQSVPQNLEPPEQQ